MDKEIERVLNDLSTSVLNFWGMRISMDEPMFHAKDLEAFVQKNAGIASPESPTRILRWLRQHHYLNYKVLSRRDSLYIALPFAA